MEIDTTAAGADTLLGVLDEAATGGFDTQQIARAGGLIECTGCNERNPSADFEVRNVRRLEGASDAADELLVASSPCPSCHRLGVLTLGYGPNASEIDAAVLGLLDLSTADSSPRIDPTDTAPPTK